MKNLVILGVATLVSMNAAQADFRPGRVRAEAKAKLTQVDGNIAYPSAQVLFQNFEDGVRDPVSFTLQLDTGVRCITAPCPSTQRVEFKITHISQPLQRDIVRYEAVEVLKIKPNVRMAPRKLFVTESSMELVAPNRQGFLRKTMWEVELHTFPNRVQTYQGEVEYLAVTM